MAVNQSRYLILFMHGNQSIVFMHAIMATKVFRKIMICYLITDQVIFKNLNTFMSCLGYVV